MPATKDDVIEKIVHKGDEIRQLKSQKASKEDIMVQVNLLKTLKAEYKSVTGEEYVAPGASSSDKKKKKSTTPSKEKATAAVTDPMKKTKKQLNKEKKKAAKAQMKSGPGPAQADSSSSAPEQKQQKDLPAETHRRLPPKMMDLQSCKVSVAVNDNMTKRDSTLVIYYAPKHYPVMASIVSSILESKCRFEQHSASANTFVDVLPYLVVPTAPTTTAESLAKSSPESLATTSESPSSSFQLINGDAAIARYLCREIPDSGLYGFDSFSTTEIDSWMDYALASNSDSNLETFVVPFVNAHLAQRSFIIGYGMTLADVAFWKILIGSFKSLDAQVYVHLHRWMTYLSSLKPLAMALVKIQELEQVSQQKQKPAFQSQKGKTAGSCPALPNAVVGQVKTRFPPEPSGYLHIGHVKACMLNHYYAKHYQGKLLVRFDDTNPTKEKSEFEQSILADLKRLEIVPDEISYTSDHFKLIHQLAMDMINKGLAYMDNTGQEQMREERMDGIDSKCRTTDISVNLELFHQMCVGAEAAKGYCLRAKIDMQAKNKTLRDPVLYRSNATPHHRTGTTYLAYPTYDLACPIVDSVEGVTHALRTTEYNDRDAQYQWILQSLELRPVTIHSFARMNFVYTMLSKRKLQWFVDQGLVTGWNDPRFPTVQGVLRRGVQVESLRDFILSQGASRRITDMEWDKFWTMNKKVIDPVAPRYFALARDSTVPLELTNVSHESQGRSIPLHPKDALLGNKVMRFSSQLLIEGDDAALMTKDEEITLMRYGNVVITNIVRDPVSQEIVKLEGRSYLEGDVKKTKKKITWLAQMNDLVPVILTEFDHLMSKAKLEEGDNYLDHLTETTMAETKAVGDHGLRNCQEGQILQLERRGYYRVDKPYLGPNRPLVLFMIPDGKSKAMSALSTKLAHR